MKKSLICMAMAALGIVSANAQMPEMQPMPLNPKVKSGKLPNGLSYYILHNEEPKERANFYIAQKVGSTLETPEQLGLAHFLEHMAFNGTKHYPGKDMLNYLQSKGIRFGADINAYTSFDETVYNIDNIPTTDTALMDSVLLVLHDWSCDLLLEEDEINAERGVIEEEWRSRNDARFRMLTSILPKIYEEYQYEQTPIGSMDVVRNFKPDVLRAYYHKWYRPDQQGIVIVGDFDAAEMEKKVIDLFSPIPMAENAAPREYPTVSDNEKPIFAYFTDKELQNGLAYVSFKYDKTPFEMRNTVQMYIQDGVLLRAVAKLVQNRLDEYSQKPECRYAFAGNNFGDFWVSKTKGAYDVIVVPKDNMADAIADAMAVVARAFKTGFTDSEYSRVKDQMLADYEKAYNERDKTKTATLAQELIRHFVDNEPSPGIETEYQLIQMLMPSVPVQAINEMCTQILTPTNQVVVVSEPYAEGNVALTEEVAINAVNNALNAQYEAYVEEAITEPLIAKLPAPGTITATSENTELGTTSYTLSNGAKVVIKPTDFSADEILMTAFRQGGKRTYPTSEAANVNLADFAFETVKMGPFDQTTLKRYLAGKKVSCSFEIGNASDVFDGSSTVKDLPTLMELLYTSFTNISPDQTLYDTQASSVKSILANQSKNPMFIFSVAAKKALYGDNPMWETLTAETFEAADYSKIMEIIKNATANAADYTFVFTGNIDKAAFEPLMLQYIASLPSTGEKTTREILTPYTLVQGKEYKIFKQPMQTPSTMVVLCQNGKLPYSIEDNIKIDLLGEILSNVYTETLREEEGGTYSPYATASLNPLNDEWMILSQFQTNSEQQEKLIKRAQDELASILANGAKADAFNKVKEADIKQYEIRVKTNNYWNAQLVALEKGIDNITGREAAIKNLTLEDFNKYISTLYDGQNLIEVVMEGVEAE